MVSSVAARCKSMLRESLPWDSGKILHAHDATKVVSAVVFVVAFVLLLGFFISKIIIKLCLPITTPLPICSVIQPSGVKTCLLNVCNAVVF